MSRAGPPAAARAPAASGRSAGASREAASAPGGAASPEEREKEMMELLAKLKEAAKAPEQATRRVRVCACVHVYL